MEINTLINLNKTKFDKFYNNLLLSKLDNNFLSKAMKYSSINGGKRIRSFLVSQSSKMVNLSSENSMIISSAIESIHAYSLIHDDLPSMDNDDFRRGKPSSHKKFGEATAILAGDALHDFAFQLISGSLKKIDPDKNLKLINFLTLCTGYDGLAGGQSLDLLFENKKISKKNIIEMYAKKTGKLFEFSFAAPFIIKGESKKRIEFSKIYGSIFGIIFQIIDDLIDEINSFKILGKTPGKDKKQGKRTLLSFIGEAKAINYCEEIAEDLIIKYKKEFYNNPVLKELLYYNIDKLK
ncbi:MAG: polyprenyl synthetase family protein [Pelagibacteraceae bacterium]|nr:polyprenyl synthetase family protein [Pelagibacteraceae bacterium]